MTDIPEKLKLIAFDLDGTLAESKQPLSPQMGELLARLLEKMPVAVMSGAGFPQFKTQLLAHLPQNANLEHLYVFPDSAAQCFAYKDGDWQAVYDQSFTETEKKAVLEALKSALQEVGLSEAPVRLWGKRIEDRGGEIAFSPLGQQAPVAEKQVWHEAHEDKRQHLRDSLAAKLPNCAVTIGGITTVDITRLGITKAYGVEQLSKITNIPIADMLYVGDALQPGGNDAAVIPTGVPIHTVTNPTDTAILITNLLREVREAKLHAGS
ncbi:MAG: HAD-IIB family hydrolase [bacterium]